jgi:hypothetical protein
MINVAAGQVIHGPTADPGLPLPDERDAGGRGFRIGRSTLVPYVGEPVVSISVRNEPVGDVPVLTAPYRHAQTISRSRHVCR